MQVPCDITSVNGQYTNVLLERINVMTNRHIIIAVALVIGVAVIYAATSRQNTGSSNIVSVTSDDFNEKVLQSKNPVLVDFWASWCGPCRQMGPIVDEIAVEYAGKINVYKVNVDDNKPLAAQYGINSIPTLIIFKNGQSISQQVGLSPKGNITQWIENSINSK